LAVSLRADAARNRAAILEAARQVFAEQGLEAPLDEIARRAGVGNATLYRRFPTRLDLIVAVFADRLAEHVRVVEEALAEPDPWQAFRRYLTAATALQVGDRGIADLVTMDVSNATEIEQLRARAFRGVEALIDRAKTAGALRPDCTTEDVFVLLQANAGLVERSNRAAHAASQRLVHVLLDGLRADAATAGPPPPSPHRMGAAMRRRSRSLGFMGSGGRHASDVPPRDA
jgi:AcrR family transcriptional regulator